MRTLIFLFFLILFFPLITFGQKLQEPNYPDCSGLREKNETYAVQDGGPYITWCQMKKQTAYVSCQCKKEKMRKQFTSQLEAINKKMKQNSDEANNLYNQFNDHYQAAHKLKGKLFDDDNTNFENDKQSAINEFNKAIQYRERQLRLLQENSRLCERKNFDGRSCDFGKKYIKYAKDAIENMKNDINEISNKEKKKKLTLVINNSNNNSVNSDISKNNNISKNNSFDNNNLNKNSNNNTVNNNSNFSNNNNRNSYPINKKNNQLNKSRSDNLNAKKYYNSAYQNAQKGNYAQGIKDLQAQKRYTTDPRERAKIDSNIKTLNARKAHNDRIVKFNQYVKRENYLNQQSLNYMRKIDAATNGDHLAAAAQKFGYAIGSAMAGRLDLNSVAGTAISVINFIGEKKRQREALEAKKRELKKKVEAENRKRELARRKYLNGLKRERNIVMKDLPEFSYPNYLTDSDINSYYYFIIYTKDNILTADYPSADITDIIVVNKYKDGTWPFENDFKTDVQKLSSKPISKIIGYKNYEVAAQKLAAIIKGFGKGGVKLHFIDTPNNNDTNNNNTNVSNNKNGKDFWGKSISTQKKITTKKDTIKKDFWGKSIKLTKKKDTIKKTKKKEFWGKPIKIKN